MSTNLRQKLFLARSHFIFIAALVVGAFLILKLESLSPDGWGVQRSDALQRLVRGEAGDYQVAVSVADKASAERLCRDVLAAQPGARCRVNAPIR